MYEEIEEYRVMRGEAMTCPCCGARLKVAKKTRIITEVNNDGDRLHEPQRKNLPGEVLVAVGA